MVQIPRLKKKSLLIVASKNKFIKIAHNHRGWFFMKKSEALILCCFVTIVGIAFGEAAYYLSFTPFSMIKFLESYLKIEMIYAILILIFCIFILLFLTYLAVNPIAMSFNHIFKYVIFSAICFLLFSLFLSFFPKEMNKMNFSSLITTFSIIIICDSIFLYSIFYQNLLRCES